MRRDHHIKLSKKSIILIILWFVFGAMVVFYGSYIEYKNRNEKYHRVRKEEPINGVIQDYIFNNGVMYLTLSDSMHIQIWSFFKNKIYMCSFIQQGDSVVRHSYSDKIYVFRNNKQHYFVADVDNAWEISE